jgi:hypothetical protein
MLAVHWKAVIKQKSPWMTRTDVQAGIEERFGLFVRWHAPYATDDQVTAAVKHGMSNRVPDAEAAGRHIGLTYEERERLAVRTMRPADVAWATVAKRQKARRRERDRERKRTKRQCQPRNQWLLDHATERTKPWESLGISRSTYYRRAHEAATPRETEAANQSEVRAALQAVPTSAQDDTRRIAA